MRIYIHFPFCRSKCPYCDFNSQVAGEEIRRQYLQAIIKELEMHRKVLAPSGFAGEEVLSIYCGGGTPSLYPPEALGRVLEGCKELFKVSAQCEISVEVNPSTWSEAELERAAVLGFNRISIGAQSFHDEMLRVLGRTYKAEEAAAAVEHSLRLAGTAVNVDLIYGIPGQTMKIWKETVRMALQFRPHHLSLYALTAHENTPLGREIMGGSLVLPEDSLVAEMYELACGWLREAGYLHYEISNFALPGWECKHNYAYWERSPYLGVGASAHSLMGERLRWKNCDDVDRYLEAIREDRLPLAEAEILSEEEVWEERVLLALRTSEGVDRCVLGENTDMDKLEEDIVLFEELGLVWSGEEKLGFTEKGMMVSDALLYRLMAG